jgi:signal transduction histidine kinase/ActR/RegA family two-component response regulator
MISLRNLPFRHQVSLALILISVPALLLASGAFVTYDALSVRAKMVDDLQTLAEIIGNNSTGALAFNDPQAATVILGALRAKPNIVAAYLYTPAGQPFASYFRDGAPASLDAPRAEAGGHRFQDGSLLLFRTTLLKGDPAGIVCIRSDLGELRSRLERYAGAVGVVLVGCILLILILSARLQAVISRPIIDLAGTARAVSINRDYSVRAMAWGADEVGDLTRAFNEMLAQIQERDAALQMAHDDLERRVDERTRQLRAEIAERRQAEEALRESEDQLRQSQKMEAVGRLAGGIAHDFNNLLTGITGYTQLLLQQVKENTPWRRYLEEIRGASERAASLTRQLLAYSRKQLLAPKVIDLNSLVSNLDAMLRRLIGEDIQLFTSLEPDLGAVKADPGQIEQVILNLVVNARDALPRGGRITVKTANVAPPGGAPAAAADRPLGQVLLEVTDTGTGMTESVKTRIFEPFFTTKEMGKGTGLGLSMVYGIVQQSGGQIKVDSAPGQGATFRIFLPRVAGAAENERARTAIAAPDGGGETVLLVEDEPMVRALVRDVLKMYGYTVLEAAHGEDAISLCRKHTGPIDLMLTDVVMPHMNGRELHDRLAPLRPDLKVLYMSGYAEGGIVHDGIIDPGTAFIPKPFTPEDLATKIRAVLDAAGNN